MKQTLKDYAIITWIAVSHFAGIYLATAVLFPGIALGCGLTTAFVAILIYLVLLWRGMAEEGPALGLLILVPLIYLTVAAGWWQLRLVGFWKPIVK